MAIVYHQLPSADINDLSSYEGQRWSLLCQMECIGGKPSGTQWCSVSVVAVANDTFTGLSGVILLNKKTINHRRLRHRYAQCGHLIAMPQWQLKEHQAG